MISTDQPDPHETLSAYLLALLGPAPDGRFLDVRWRTVAGTMRRRFLPASTSVAALARVIAHMGARGDVYLGAALRDGDTHGGRAAIGAMHVAYVESDSPTTLARLAAFALPPSMLIASGTPGHLHVYWQLDDRYPTVEVETVNRRLALALDGDPTCADAARILRPPGTLNYKHEPPLPVRMLALQPHARYPLTALAALLGEDPCPAAARERQPQRERATGDRGLLAIPAVEYARVLTGRVPNREGKILCPFHDDHDPSLQLYPDGGFYCFGSGCRAGGSIFDFAGRVWGITPRGAGFIELRRRLTDLFAGERSSSDQPTAERVSPSGLSRTP